MQSLWQQDIERPAFPALQGDRKTDVLIIGGGIAGLLIACFLHRNGVKYILLEKGSIASGNTGNTTAKITAQHGLCYQKLLRSGGAERAQKYLHINNAALQKYAELSKEFPCDFECCDNFVYAKEDRKKLEEELRALHRIGYAAEFSERLPLPFRTAGGVKFPRQAQFHPLKFLFAISKDLHIFENTAVREMIGTTAVTDRGKIHAQRVVVATHFPFLNKHGSYFLKLYQHRSYVVALQNAPHFEGMYVDEDMRGLSFRNAGDYLLLGGGSHRTGKGGGGWQELRRVASKWYPKASESAFWAAQDCMSLDGVPYIGQYSARTPRMYVASGFNKWGMTGAMVAAMLLCDMLTGQKNDCADVFSPSRSMLKPQLFLNAAESTLGLLTPIPKRCPHLGCALKWNAAEHSWDCPCHGSRFAEDGKVLDNPANGDLNT